jgi:cobalt-zinc-cadmium efflux system outer membrane protein
LPLFERGQADAAQAASALRAAQSTRELLRAQARRDLERLLGQAQRMHERQQLMREKTIPMARRVVEQLTAAVRTGGAPLQEVLLARRTLGDLLEDSADLDLAALEVSLAVARIVSPPPSLEGGPT